MKLERCIFLLIFCVTISCNDHHSLQATSGTLTIQFNHDWNGEAIDFDELKYTNAIGQDLSITKLRYLISDFVIQLSDGTSINMDNHFLVDVNSGEITINLQDIPFNNYTVISFTFGFNEEKNIDGAYSDLNSTSWNWPTMLGGGYHFMQFEGKYDSAGLEAPFAYHMGTARVSTGIFEQNYFEVNLDQFNFKQESTLNINMNVAGWFTNPSDWDLEIYNVDLMTNYNAQKLMNTNGKSVFSLGEIN